MATATRNARAKFLDGAACTYSVTDPATSAHLMLQRRLLGTPNVKFYSDDSSSPSCEACGTILVPGWTSRTSISDESLRGKGKSSKKAVRNRRADSKKFLLVECLICHRHVKSPLAPTQGLSKAALGKKASSSSNMKTQDVLKSTPSNDTPKSATTNAGSKQRAKARKGGLQAMLEKSKQSTISSLRSGMDLMDLMKHG